MDIKIKGITKQILKEALAQAKEARMEILDVMEELMESVNVIMPKLYRATIEKLRTK